MSQCPTLLKTGNGESQMGPDTELIRYSNLQVSQWHFIARHEHMYKVFCLILV